jgi:hypothetical protein
VVYDVFTVAHLRSHTHDHRYAQKEKRQRSMTVNELELTELLLGDVTMQKDRIAEEHDLMSRAWEISKDDLVMGDVIGSGGMGVS